MGKRGASVNPPPPDPAGQEERSGVGQSAAGAPAASVPPVRSPAATGPATTRPAPRPNASPVPMQTAASAPSSHAPAKPSRAPLPGARGSKPPPSSPMPLLKAGHVVGRYRLLVPIGAGGMAQVWAARP